MRAVYRTGVPDSVNMYNTPARSIPGEHPAGPVHSGQVAPEPEADDQRRAPSRHQLRLAARALPGGDAVRRGTLLRQDVRHSRLEGREPALLGRLRHRRRWPHGAEVRGEPLHHPGRQQRARPHQSDLSRERHASVAGAVGVRIGEQRRLRPQRRPAAANQRARSRRTGSVSATSTATSRATSGRGRRNTRRRFSASCRCNMVVSAGYTRREKLGNFGSRNVAVPEDTYIHADRHRSEQRQDGDGLQPGSGAARQAGLRLDQRARARQHLQRHRHHARQADEQRLDDDRRHQHRRDHRLGRATPISTTRTRKSSAAASSATTRRSRSGCRDSTTCRSPFR